MSQLYQLISVTLLLIVVSPLFINADEPTFRFTVHNGRHSGQLINARIGRYGVADGDHESDPDNEGARYNTFWQIIPSGSNIVFKRAYGERGYILGLYIGAYVESYMVRGRGWDAQGQPIDYHVVVFDDSIHFWNGEFYYAFKINPSKGYGHVFRNTNHTPYCFGGRAS